MGLRILFLVDQYPEDDDSRLQVFDKGAIIARAHQPSSRALLLLHPGPHPPSILLLLLHLRLRLSQHRIPSSSLSCPPSQPSPYTNDPLSTSSSIACVAITPVRLRKLARPTSRAMRGAPKAPASSSRVTALEEAVLPGLPRLFPIRPLFYLHQSRRRSSQRSPSTPARRSRLSSPRSKSWSSLSRDYRSISAQFSPGRFRSIRTRFSGSASRATHPRAPTSPSRSPAKSYLAIPSRAHPLVYALCLFRRARRRHRRHRASLRVSR